MDNFYNQIQHLLKTQYELDAGIYTIKYIVKYKGESVILEQKVTIKEVEKEDNNEEESDKKEENEEKIDVDS